MSSKKALIAVAIILLLIVGSAIVGANGVVDQRGGLAGEIVKVVAMGATVREGDILLQVNTLTGPVAAARATTDGVVVDILVKVGDNIQINDVVARIKTGK